MEFEKLLYSWQTPATKYPLSKKGKAEIIRSPQRRGNYLYWGMDGYLTYKVVNPIPITALKINNKVWMVDDPPQMRSMEIFGQQARGKVITTGLGLGLVVHELVKNLQVSKITVVEINQDVIDLLSPLLPKSEKIEIVKDDFYSYIHKCSAPDTVVADLWVAHGKEQKLHALAEVCPLAAYLRLRFPQAQLNFHGFVSLSDIKVVSDENSAEFIRVMQETNRGG